MPTQDFFPQRPDAHPAIYAYSDTDPNHKGILKVGYTAKDVEQRVREQFPVLQPEKKPYKIEFAESAMRDDGTFFLDHPVHDWLEAHGCENINGEWYRCTPDQVRAGWIAVRDRTENDEARDQDFSMRPEQAEAVRRTREYFESVTAEGSQRTPKFLWNAKMRFGKTFATYELAKSMGMRRVLVLTFKPAVQSAWQEDLNRHVDFEGWQFVSRGGKQYEDCDPQRPIVCFGSFQDYLGRDSNGNIKARHEWVRLEDWDLVVFDEYHFGAWRETAKKLFDSIDEDEEKAVHEEVKVTGNEQDETWLPIVTKYFLFLSGTPFRALNSGEFIEEQIFNWTYSDEQEAKANWNPADGDNPYASLPRMVMLTYQMPEEIKRIALNTETNQFDLNVFFSAEGEGEDAQFKFKDHVQMWLDLMRGQHMPATKDELKLGEKPAMPFSDIRLLNVLGHTLWFLPNVASCYAMANLLKERQNTFYHDFKINVQAGAAAGIGLDALPPVQRSMREPLESRTITLSCGKLTTGVTVKPWTGVFMLSNVKSAETYFQTAFRVQSPWTVKDDDGRTQIIKNECYVFDFALDRALTMVSDYSTQLATDPKKGPEQKVDEFVKFLPVLAYDGSRMKEISAAEVLDIAMAGTSAALLAKRWESALLVNVDNDTLRRLLANDEAINALMNIEGFRSLNDDIKTIINKSEAVKKVKKEKGESLTPKEKKELTEEEKEFKSKRKEIQTKLIKFATRIPVFMYLTDYREETLHDVITQLEPGLFKKVTGLSVDDFNLLVGLGVFNAPLMNDAVYKFRRYEDASLVYTGVNKHAGERVGLYDTTLSEYDYLAAKQQESMIAPDGSAIDLTSAEPVTRPVEQIGKFPVVQKVAQQKVVQQTEKPKASAEPVSTTVSTKTDWVADVLTNRGIEFVDKREKSGALWALGGVELAPAMGTLRDRGADFTFKPSGGKATKFKEAWYLTGYPDELNDDVAEETPAIDYSKVVPGYRVIHKGLGGGTVKRINGGLISVAFDDSPNRQRAFTFPGAFEQGLLSHAAMAESDGPICL